MIRRGGYGEKIEYRLGFWPKLPTKTSGKKRIWIQAVSVGEVSSLSKLMDSILQDKSLEVVLSGTTSTGLKLAEEKFGRQVLASGPFPLDWFPFSKKAWKQIDPDMVVTVDSELWPEHFHQALSKAVPIFIINARLSDRSFFRLKRINWLRSLVFPENLTVLTSSERQTKRWKEININSSKVFTAGNLKTDAVKTLDLGGYHPTKLVKEFGFEKDSIVIAGISTWPNEEKLLLEITQSLRLENFDVRLLLIPRHAERRQDVIKEIHSCGLPYQVRTRGKAADDGNVVYLADTTGELANLIRVADLGFLGKTMPPNQGGQNPIEPIALGIPLVIGPNYQNFHETCTDMFLDGAAIKSENSTSLVKELTNLAKDSLKRNALQDASRNWMLKQGSPSDFTLNKIKEALGSW